MYHSDQEAVGTSPNIVACMIIVNVEKSYALLYFGAIHSLISSKFVNKLNVSISKLWKELVISTPLGEKVGVDDGV
jgi:hypothetical protein